MFSLSRNILALQPLYVNHKVTLNKHKAQNRNKKDKEQTFEINKL